MVNAKEILPEAEEHRTSWENHIRDVAELFHKQEGELLTREKALNLITEELEISESIAAKTVSALIGDLVDPVVQIPVDGERYVGIIDYNEYDGAYGYVEYDDIVGEKNRVVCAQCVQKAESDREVVHATSGSGSFDEDASFDELYESITEHYDDEHDVKPESVETGASLLSGTTISSNTAIHTGNESSLSFFDGTNLTADTTGDANTLDGNDATAFYQTTGNEEFIVETRSSDPSSPATGRIWMIV